MASLGSYTRSAARGTYSAYRSVPIRWRLAGGSAALTFVILASFAVIVGVLTSRQVRTQFATQLASDSSELGRTVSQKLRMNLDRDTANCAQLPLAAFAESSRAKIRVFDGSTGKLLCTEQPVLATPAVKATTKGGAKAKPRATSAARVPIPSLFGTFPNIGRYDSHGYQVSAVGPIRVSPKGADPVVVLYAQPLSDIDQTLARVQAFLLAGVLGGAVLALLAGLFVSERAMSPIKELTSAAREIARTEDTRRQIPHPEAEDEIAELARTLEQMLDALDASRTRTQALLDRQREFVADASHELRTPLTSVLANLELLTEELEGEQSETAEAALRSTRRMRRLVSDLLLLARADAARSSPHRPTDLGQILVDAAAELGPVADGHELVLDAQPAPVLGAGDELHRLILNLLENAIRHTPPGTRVRARTTSHDDIVELVVEDTGPGISPDLRERVFERFIRGGRDGGRGSGLGLAIVRSVAGAHGGTVTLTPARPGQPRPGARFVIRLPGRPLHDPAPGGGDDGARAPAPGAPEDLAAQTSTTTGRTIGRRRSRS